MAEATITDAMIDPALFGPIFGGDSFAAWRALLGGFYGLPLDDAKAEMFKTLTGRTETPQDAANELWVAVAVAAARAMWPGCWRSMRHVSAITGADLHRVRWRRAWLSQPTGSRPATSCAISAALCTKPDAGPDGLALEFRTNRIHQPGGNRGSYRQSHGSKRIYSIGGNP